MYRVRESLRGLAPAEGKRRIVLIPPGATLTTPSPPNGDQFITVIWEGATIHVFTQDFRERTMPITTSDGQFLRSTQD